VADRCLRLLQAQGLTVSTAESLTAGLVVSTLAEVPGASASLRGGLVAYATEVKTSVLGVDDGIVARHGVVSAECAAAMATRACALFGSSVAVATTGVAGPDRQEGKPPGTVFVAVAEPSGVCSRRLSLSGTRDEIRRATTAEALRLLEETLSAG
jgi:PncC family amidohydrolase